MKKMFFLLMFINIIGNIYPQQFGLPSDNPEVITYFYTEALSLLDFMELTRREEWGEDTEYYNYDTPINFNFIPFLCSTNIRWGFDGQLFQYNGMVGSVLRFNKYLSMPLFFNATGGSIEVHSDITSDRDTYWFHSLYTGGGLILSTKLGTLGAFVGYYKSFGETSFFADMGERSLRYGTIPVLNVSKYPLLKYVLSAIENYLSFDFHESKLNISHSTTKIISRSIDLGYFKIPSIYYFYSDEYLNVALRNRVHGGGITFTFDDGDDLPLDLSFEIGNREIYETVPGMFYEKDLFEKNYWYYDVSFQLNVGGGGMYVKGGYRQDDYMGKLSWADGLYGLKVVLAVGFRNFDFGWKGNIISDMNVFFRTRQQESDYNRWH